MGTTNTLDLNNRINELADSYPANKVVMSDGTTSVEDALDEVAEKMGNMRMTKLWENPDPTQEFTSGNITLSSNDYDLLLVLARYKNTGASKCPAMIGNAGLINFTDYNNAPICMYRSYVANGNSVTFGNTYVNGNISNSYLVPEVIYGIKIVV